MSNRISTTFHVKTKSNNNNSYCDPFIKIKNKFSIKIDNQIYPRSHRLDESIDLTCLKTYNKTIKTILLWNTFYSVKDYHFGLGKITPFIKNNCPITNCEITDDKNKLNESDYVITHMTLYRDSFSKPINKRPLNQRWIFYLAESPMHFNFNFKEYKNFYNLTATYRLDSNFNKHYERRSQMEWKLNDQFNINNDFYSNKISFAAALISNCNRDKSNRLDYVKKLQNHIKVDVFGKCGQLCPTKFNQTGKNGSCKEIIAKEYKFYFAFENSVCNEYITEKFFYFLKFNIIPVVLGGGQYDYYVGVIYFKLLYLNYIYN